MSADMDLQRIRGAILDMDFKDSLVIVHSHGRNDWEGWVDPEVAKTIEKGKSCAD